MKSKAAMQGVAPSQPPADGAPASTTEPASLAALFQEQYGPMVRVAYLLVGSVPLAEELVQDAFARMHKKWDKIERRRAYLRTSVVNGCRSHHRRAVLERTRRPDPPPDAVPPPGDELSDALASLPSRQRAALVLRFYQDLPESEIALALGCRPGTVKSLLHRGLQQLRKVVQQ